MATTDQVSLNTASTEEEALDFTKSDLIPSHFIQVPFLCCAFTCANCSFPSCFGCKGFTQCLCIEEEGFCCKYVSGHKACCICLSDSLECVTCPSGFRCYRQIFCCEWVCGCPFEKAFKETDIHFTNIPNRDGGSVTEDSRPCMAVCCEVSSLYLSFPGCLSAYSKGTCCCLETQLLCCKPMCCGSNKRKKSLLCLWQRSNIMCITPTTCCKSITQCFCIDNRCAIPCDDEVPCLCMPLPFCTLCAKFGCHIGCCETMAQVTSQAPTKV